MNETLPEIFHSITFHEGIEWFESHEPPQHIFLTNRHHYRHSSRFAESFGTKVWCHKDGLHEFTKGEGVKPFNHGDELPGGIVALDEKLAELTNLKRELKKLQNQWKVLKTIKEHKDEGICPQIESVIVRQKMTL